MMRILVIGLDPSVLDADSPSAQRQRAYFKDWDTEIFVLATGSRKEIYLGKNIRVIRTGGASIMSAVWSTMREARKILKTEIVDVVTMQDPFLCGLTAWMASRGIRVSRHLQDHSAFFSRPAFGMKEKVLTSWSRWLAKHVDRIRTVSERGKRGLISTGVEASRIDVISVQSDLSAFLNLERSRKMDPEHPRLFCIARLSREKGVDLLLESFELVLKKIPGASLTIVGDGPEREMLKSMSKSFGLEKSVMFAGAGATSDLGRFFSDADIYVQPSRFEGWGMAVVEAAAAGLPVVMTDVGCAGEFIHDKNEGNIVSDFSAASMSEILLDVIRDPGKAREMGLAARAAAKKLPTAEMSTMAIRASFEAAAKRRNHLKRLCLVTQRVDEKDSNLHMHISWISFFASRVEQLTVIAQSVGKHQFPSNVEVLSLGKEKGFSKIRQLGRFFSFLARRSSRMDGMLVLMVPMYVILAGPFAFLFRFRISLWYVHRHISRALRFAERIVQRIYSSAPESFRLATSKVRFVGHAIDTDYFSIDPTVSRSLDRIIAVGRVTRVKHLERIIEAFARVRTEYPSVTLEIIGAPVQGDDESYLQELHQLAERLEVSENIQWRGVQPREVVRAAYRQAALHVNACQEGSFDKVVLEGMACGCPTVVTNPAFRNVLSAACVVSGGVDALAQAMLDQLRNPAEHAALRKSVLDHHAMKTTLGKMLDDMGF